MILKQRTFNRGGGYDRYPLTQAAFTLAEVLVTLGVIGIVAAMTIPNLVQSYKKKVVETKLVKFYSMMNNAIRMAEADYGPQSTWTDYYVAIERDEDNNDEYIHGDKHDLRIKKYFAPYLKIESSEEVRDVAEGVEPVKVYYLSDGTAFGVPLNHNYAIIFYISNPKKCVKNSDYYGFCAFPFTFLPSKTDVDWVNSDFSYTIGKGMNSNLFKWDGKEESLMTNSSYGCKNGKGTYCTEVIRRNGWKIPDNYPFKF